MKKISVLFLRRISISAFFFLHGICFASWASRIPNIQQSLHLNETSLGAVLFALPVGSFITLPFSGWVIAKKGSRRVIWATAFIYSCMLLCIGLASSVWQLVVALFFFGSSGNMFNIAFNTQAIGLEKNYGKRIMSSFHGVWSVAGLAGAAVGAFMMAMGISTSLHFIIITGFSFLIILICGPKLLHEDGQQQSKKPIFSKPEGAIVGLGMIAFCSMMCQGAMFDWTGVYFKKVLHANAGWTGAGYTAFMLSMAATRFLADWMTHRIGLKKMLIWSGVLTAAGLCTIIFSHFLLVALFGCIVVGIGVSPVVPLVFSAVAQSKVMAAPVAIAAVSTLGFVGLLIGPPLVGFVAGVAGLPVSFIILATVGITVSILAKKIQYDMHKEEGIPDSTMANSIVVD